MSIQEKKERYMALTHAIQSGVAFELEKVPDSASPKHLRVGVNMAMVEHGALVGLLMKKGLITEDEYWDALLEGLEQEKVKYERILSDLYGGKITIA